MTALSVLNATIGDAMSDSDINWVQFVSDHVSYIRANSAKVYPSAQVMAQNRYDMKRYLRNVMSRNQEMWWIVLRINDMASDLDFTLDTVRSGIYVPTETLMNTLYASFISTSATRVTAPIGQG